jgi:hypothetical protein
MTSRNAVAIVRVVRDAAILLLASVGIALASNALRRDGLPLVQRKEYDILVPCAETVGNVLEVDPQDPILADKTSLLVDARSKPAFDEWHLPAAINIPFDYLASTSEGDIRRVTSSRAARVVIYGDGEDPDSGRELGKELAGKGIRNVFAIKGGAPALHPTPSPARTP